MAKPVIVESSRMWNPGIQVLESRRKDLASLNWRLDLCSPFWRIYVHDRSGAFIEQAGNRHELAAGQLWAVPAWVRFRTGFRRPVVQDYAHFTFSGLPQLLLRRRFDRPVCLRTTDALRLLIVQWRSSISEAGPFSHLCSAGALAHAVMASLISSWTAEDQSACRSWLTQTDEIRPALEILESSTGRPAGNRELSRRCGMSEDHFIRKFRNLIGLTPAEYGRGRRVSLTAEWLTGTNRTIEEIAEASGFTDRSHFSRVFKQRLGVTPVAYRRAHRREMA